jgi:predicted pyridoxine 5'-phosphate oxidase superfamily flavin-nucleotide-binding protein
MRNEFLRTLATPAVQAEQVRSYGRSRVPASSEAAQLLGPDEQAFIAARDSFYLSSINEDGWPYIQHRGGPKGFVRVVNGTQLIFGDYTGNRQLISAGNIRAERRVALFFMDYPARERLKIIGHADVLMPDEGRELIASLSVPKGAAIERVFRVDVVGFDWNCPKYITPRFTAAEIDEAVAPLRARIAELEAALVVKNQHPAKP